MPTGWSETAAIDILTDKVSEYPYVKAHIGDPGAAGTLNPSTLTDRELGDWGTPVLSTDGRSVEVTWDTELLFENFVATETVTHLSGWSTVGPAGGVCGWTGQLTAPQVPNGSDLPIAPGAYKLRQPIAYNP